MTIQANVDIYDINITIDYTGYSTATLNGLNTGKLIYKNIVFTSEILQFLKDNHANFNLSAID